MTTGEDKRKHLEFIQLTITRMAADSFLVKAWCVTIIAALFAISADGSKYYLLIGYIPLLTLWGLDAFYLRQEKLFRNLYNDVRVTDEKNIDYSLDTSKVAEVPSVFNIARTVTLEWFYGSLLLVLLISTGYLIIKQLG